MAAAQQAIDDARDAAANETKSSAGDKYETGREMMQQEIDLNTVRLTELQKLKAILDTISPEQSNSTVVPGSIVFTSEGKYYLSISIGKLTIDGSTYYCLSAASPLGRSLMGLKKGDSFSFNGKSIIVEDVL